MYIYALMFFSVKIGATLMFTVLFCLLYRLTVANIVLVCFLVLTGPIVFVSGFR